MSKEQTDLFGIGDFVETAKGAKFWGEIIAFDNDMANPGCTVRAVDGSGFDGTKHVYPMKQLRRRASPSPAGGVQVVKPLEWTEEDMDGNTATWWSAACATTRLAYEVRVTSRGTTRARMVGEDWTDFPGSPAAAKAAAQSDYEARILSALSSQAQTTGGVRDAVIEECALFIDSRADEIEASSETSLGRMMGQVYRAEAVALRALKSGAPDA